MDATIPDTTNERIGRIRLSEFQKLKNEGFLADLDISGQSIFVKATDWGELGVGQDSTRARRMSPGRKWLYPKESVNKLNVVVTRIRQAFAEHTREISGFRPSRYLHYKTYTSWRDKWQQLKTEFEAVKQELIAEHDEAVDLLADEMGQIAHEAWDACNGEGILFDSREFTDLDVFTDAVIAKALAKMPTAEQIEDALQVDYHISRIYGMEDIAKDEARAQAVRAQAQLEAERVHLENALLQGQLDHQERMARMEEEQKRIQIEEMISLEAAHIREQAAAITSPLEETFAELRQQMAREACEMIRSINKNGFLHGKSAQRGLDTLVKLFEMRSIVDDRRLLERLQELRAAIGPVGDQRTKATPERSTDQVLVALESIKELVNNAHEDFLSEPSRFELLDGSPLEPLQPFTD